MNNQERAVKMLKDAGYEVTTIHSHTVVALDPVHCTSGSLAWRETRQVPMNVAGGLYQVIRFITDRE